MTSEQAEQRRTTSSNYMSTPWGVSQLVTHHTEGLVFVSTASHGGFFVADALLERMEPALLKTVLERGGRIVRDEVGGGLDTRHCGVNWFEEDCEAAAVVLGFPELFTSNERCNALQAFAQWYPNNDRAYRVTEHCKRHNAEMAAALQAVHACEHCAMPDAYHPPTETGQKQCAVARRFARHTSNDPHCTCNWCQEVAERMSA